MSLPHDIARCPGAGSAKEGWRDGCKDCLRRTSKPPKTAQWVPWMAPPTVIAFDCQYHVPQKEQRNVT